MVENDCMLTKITDAAHIRVLQGIVSCTGHALKIVPTVHKNRAPVRVASPFHAIMKNDYRDYDDISDDKY